MTATIRQWIGNASAVAQVQTYKPGQQPANTTITATVNGKSISYLSVSGTNDDLIAGLITALNSATAQELKEITWSALVDVPAVASPNSKTLQMKSATPGQPFTVAISLTTPPTVTVSRTALGRHGVNEQQKLTISPNGKFGNFTVTWSGQTTDDIPLPPQPLTAATAAGSGLVASTSADSVFKYAVAFVTAHGETEAGAVTSLTVTENTTANGSLTAIPTGPSGVTARRIYRTKADGSTFYLLHEIADNSTTTYTDSTVDGSLGAQNPPSTNFAFEGAVQALSNVGAGNFKVGGAAAPAVPSSDPTTQIVPEAIEYLCEFTGDLGDASQALMTANVDGITVLPTITVTETQAGSPIQSAIDKVGWAQILGQASPSGPLYLTFPDLDVTTAGIEFDASADDVLAAIQAAVPAAYVNSFAVTSIDAGSSRYTWQIAYQGLLANQVVQQCVVDVSDMIPAASDTILPVQEQTQEGSATGRDEQVTVTVNSNPAAGTWQLSVVDPNNGNVVLAASTAIDPGATAADVQTALGGASLAAVSGADGGPYEITLVGEIGSRKLTVLWSSALSSGASSAPASNTTALPAPTSLSASHGAGPGGNWPATGTYYFSVQASNSIGGIIGHGAEASATISDASDTVTLNWTPVTGATDYEIFMSSTSGDYNGGANTNIGSSSGTTFTVKGNELKNSLAFGYGGSDGSTLSATLNSAGGSWTPDTYYWKVTAVNAAGETTGSNEVALAMTVHQVADLSWNAVAGAVSYNIYRADASGGESSSPALVDNVAGTTYTDTGTAVSSGSVPASNTSALSAPTQTTPSTASSGGGLATGTYYYVVTATNSYGETTASNEESIAVTGPSGEVTVNWGAVTGATGYKIYRGTSAGSEDVLVATIGSGATVTYTDTSDSSAGSVQATVDIVETAAGQAAVNERQVVTLNGATGGSFQIAGDGAEETGNIAYNETAANVQADLETMFGSGNLTVTGSDGGPFTVTFLGDLAGHPQPLLVGIASGLTGSVTTAQSLVNVTDATGPNHWNNDANWNPSGVPVTGDSAIFANSNSPCLYGLDQSAVTLLNLTIDMSYSGGKIGLPAWNGKYYEYRDQYLQIGVSGDITIGNGKGSGPSLVKLDTGTEAASILVNNVGNSSDPSLPTIIWKGNRASGSTVINLNKGKMAIAPFIGETATVDTIRQNYISNKASDTYLYVGGGATITTWNKNGGDADCYASVTTLTHEEGTFSLYDSAGVPSTVGTLGLLGGSFYHAATGTITALSVGTGAVYDRTEDSRPVTITDTKIYGKSSFMDPHGSITFTNDYQLIGCGYPDLVKFDVGSSLTGNRTKVSF